MGESTPEPVLANYICDRLVTTAVTNHSHITIRNNSLLASFAGCPIIESVGRVIKQLKR